jgi:transposase InsO family protein
MHSTADRRKLFHTLKLELVHQCRWATRAETRHDLFATVEGYDNRPRIRSALGYITPKQAERKPSSTPPSASSGRVR